jgi:hypothetical protein
MKAAAATSQYQQPPEHADIERSLIVSALLDGATIDEASSIVGPADFYRTANRILWQAILDVHGAGLPVGIDTVSLQLKESGKLAEVGGSVSLARLLDEVPAASSVEFIATKIKEAANWRRLLEITNKAAWAAKEGKVFSDTVAEVLREVEAIKRAGTTAKAPIRAADLAEFLSLQIPPRDFVLTPIIPTQGLVMLYAPRGIGKTLLALFMAYSIATGQPVCRWRAPSPRRILYMDGEMPAVTMQERTAGIVRAHPVEPAPGYFKIITPDLQDKSINLATSAGQAAVESHVEAAEVVFVDNLATLCRSGRENETESWHPVQDWILNLRRRGKAVVMVHHSNKTGGQRGTSSREDVLDTVIALRRPSDYLMEQGARFEVHLEKARGIVGADARPFEAHLVTDEFGVMQWVCRDIEDAEAETVSRLKDEGLSLRDIASETGLSKSKVHRLLRKGGTA